MLLITCIGEHIDLLSLLRDFFIVSLSLIQMKQSFNQSNVTWLINHYSKHFGISLKEINTVKRFNKAFIESLELIEAAQKC